MGVARPAWCLVAAVVMTAACGSSASASYQDSHSAQQIVNDASKSTGSARSFHMTIDETTQDGPQHADLDVDGSNVNGKLTASGLSVRIIHVDGQTFVYGADLAALFDATKESQAAAVVKARASDKWVLMPADFWNSSFTDIIDVQKMATCLKSAAGLQKKGTSTISGQQVVEVDDQTASQMYIQTAAPHYFARVVFEGVDSCVTDSTASSQTIDLTKVGQKLNVTAPTGYVDLATLAAGG
jgi:hypothetical protein